MAEHSLVGSHEYGIFLLTKGGPLQVLKLVSKKNVICWSHLLSFYFRLEQSLNLSINQLQSKSMIWLY